MDTNADVNKENEKEEEYSINDMMKRMMLAGVGAISIINEELQKHIDKLVERGEITQIDREEIISKMNERRMKFMHHRREYAHKYVTEALENLNVPNRKDIDNLSQKITNLEKKIDELIKPRA